MRELPEQGGASNDKTATLQMLPPHNEHDLLKDNEKAGTGLVENDFSRDSRRTRVEHNNNNFSPLVENTSIQASVEEAPQNTPHSYRKVYLSPVGAAPTGLIGTSSLAAVPPRGATSFSSPPPLIRGGQNRNPGSPGRQLVSTVLSPTRNIGFFFFY